MSQAKDKVKWCLRKAEKEIEKSEKHRGLIKINPDIEKASEHIKKVEHYIKASLHLKTGDFTDITASTLFYAMYHSLLAIITKQGYESGNQECTFALMYFLIEEEKIEFDKKMLEIISLLDRTKDATTTSIDLREQFQYGTKIFIEDDKYQELLKLSRKVISKAKEIIEK